MGQGKLVIGRGGPGNQLRVNRRIRNPHVIRGRTSTQPVGCLLKRDRYRDRIGKARLINGYDITDRVLDDGRIRIARDRAVEGRVDDEITMRQQAAEQVENDRPENWYRRL